MKKIIISTIALLFCSIYTSYSQTTIFRTLNPDDSTLCYVYTINILPDSTANIVRTSETAIQDDIYQTIVIGEGAVLNPVTDEINLPQNGSYMQWFKVDINFEGLISSVNGGNTKVSCTCKKKIKDSTTPPDCKPAMNEGGCVTCVPNFGCATCNEPKNSFPDSPGDWFNVPIIVNAKSVIFNIN